MFKSLKGDRVIGVVVGGVMVVAVTLSAIKRILGCKIFSWSL